MNDLAPLVAAALRDQVVEDMQKEIEELRKSNRELQRKLQERNPNRSVELKMRMDNLEYRLLKERTVNIVNDFGRGLIFHSLFARYDNPAYNLFNGSIKLKDLPQLELWIDGESALCCDQLEFHYRMYKYETQFEEFGKYVVLLCACSGQNFRLQIEVLGVPPEEHAAVLGLASPVNFPPPDIADSHNFNAPAQNLLGGHRMWTFERVRQGTVVPRDRVMHLLGEKNVCIRFGEIKCTKEFFFDHLAVPYDSQGVE